MKLRKIIAIGIAACSILSGAISSIAYAETSIDGNTNSGGSMDSGTDAAYAHKFMAYPENQGYRISVVDKNGDRVTNSVDIVNYAPNDLLNGKGLSETTNTNGGETYLGGFNLYANYLGWDDYSSSGKNKRNSFFYSSGIKTEKFDGNTWKTGGVPDKSGKYGIITTQVYPIQDIKEWFVKNYNSKASLSGADTITENNVNLPLPSKLNKSTGTFEAGGTNLMNYLQTYMIKTGGSADNEADKIINNASVFMNMAVLLRDNSGNPTSSASYLFRFIDPALQSKIGTISPKGTPITQADTIAENGYKVIIEPLYWFVPEFLTTDSTLISMSNHKNSFNSFKGVCYGTASYISKYSEEALNKLSIINDDRMKKIWVGPNWATANLGITTMMIATNDSDLGIREPSQAGLSPKASLANSYDLYSLANDNNYKDIGYSLHIYDKVFVSVNALSTWNNTSGEGPSPNPPTAGNKNVVKFYMKKSADGTTYVPYKNYTTKSTANDHSIVNEDNGKYKVDSWFVSKTFSQPTSDSENYNSYFNGMSRTQAGTGPGTVTLSDDNGETTLYIKLIADTSNNVVNLNGLQQLNLYQNELSYPYKLSSFRSDGSLEELHYTFPNEYADGVDVEEWEESYTDSKGDEHTRTRRTNHPWHRELTDGSYNINLLNGFDYNSTTFIGGQGVFAGQESGKVNTNDGNRGANIHGFDSESLNPNYYFTYYRDKVKDLVTLYPNKNSSGIINELSLIGITNPSYTPNQNRVAASGEGSYTNTFNTSYNYDNLDKTLSWASVGGYERDDSGSYDGNPNRDINTINTVYNVENNLNTNYYVGTSTGQDTSGISVIDKSGFSHFGMTFGDETTTSHLNYRTTVTNPKSMQFYPFIRMNYASVGNPSPTNVIVTGNQLRKFSFNNTVDVAVYKQDQTVPSLILDSNQWNMHARTQSFLSRNKISDKESVLPGGAVYTLRNNDKGQRWIGVRTYQVVLPDGDMSKKVSGDIQSYSEANGVLNSFLSEIPTTLSNYNIEQWVKRGLVENGIYKTFENSNGSTVAKVSGTNNSKSKLYTKLWSDEKHYADVYVNGQATSTLNKNTLNSNNDKYYLKANQDGVNGARLSVIDTKSDKIVWTIKGDEAGNITISNDKGLSASINSKQSANELISKSADIATMDSRTHAVSNFVSALERNKGTDRNGQPWYNEGFESIQIVESYNAYRIGFNPSDSSGGVRSSALDPKLTGYLKDRADTFRYGDEEYYSKSASGAPLTSDNIKDIMSNKVRSSIFKTSNYSETNPSVDGYIGSFDGNDVTVGDMDFLMFSKNFYIPNATVMDLN